MSLKSQEKHLGTDLVNVMLMKGDEACGGAAGRAAELGQEGGDRLMTVF